MGGFLAFGFCGLAILKQRGGAIGGKIIGREKSKDNGGEKKGSSRARGERLRGIFCTDFLRREGSRGF